MTIEFQMTGEKLIEVMQTRMGVTSPCIPKDLTFEGQTYQVAWIDIGVGNLAISDLETSYILNELIEDSIKPPKDGGTEVRLQRLQVMQQITAEVCHRSAMKDSNIDQAPTIEVGMQLEIDLEVRVNVDGQPLLCSLVKEVHNITAPLDQENKESVAELIKNHANTCIPLSLAPLSKLEGVGVEDLQVFNAGIAAQLDLSLVCIRFETAAPDSDAKTRWEAFYNGGFPNRLHGRQWSMLIPKKLLGQGLSQRLQEELADNSKFALQSSVNVIWAPWGEIPRMVVSFHGEAIDACAGIDVDVAVTMIVHFFVPKPNVFRTAIHLSLDGDFGDEFLCTLLAAKFWPIVGAMFIDVAEGKDWAWGTYIGGLVGGPAVISIGLVGFFSSNAPASIVDDHLEDWVEVPDSDSSWYQDLSFPSSIGDISDLSMELVAPDPDGLVLGGSINLDEPQMPELKIVSSPFEGWRLSQPCHSLYKFEAEASLSISADPKGNVPLKVCDVRVINDPTGFYYHPSLAGSTESSLVFSIKVHNPPLTWNQNPYDLEVLILSNHGCRLITLGSPGPLPEVSGDAGDFNSAWLAWKATHCWKFMSIWGMIGMMNPEWLIDPPPEAIFAQHWLVEVVQAIPGDRITLRDPFGRDLMTRLVGANGRAVVSGIIENARQNWRVWLVRNGAQLSSAEFRAFAQQIPIPESEPAGRVTIKQTLLQLQSDLALETLAEAVALDYQSGFPTTYLKSSTGLSAINLADPGSPSTVKILRDTTRLHFRPLTAEVSTEEELHREPALRDKQSKYGATTNLWYAGAARLGQLYVRLAEGGRRLRVYRIVSSHIGFERHPTLEEVLEIPHRDRPSRKAR